MLLLKEHPVSIYLYLVVSTNSVLVLLLIRHTSDYHPIVKLK